MTRGKRTAAISLTITAMALYVYMTFLEDEKDLLIPTEDPRGDAGLAASPATRLPRVFGVTGAAREDMVTEEASFPTVELSEMEIMSERQREVHERCAEVMTPSERAQEWNSKEFLVSVKYHLVWCNVFKAASSTWLDNFLRMAGYSKVARQNLKSSPVELARKVYPRPTPHQLHAYLHQLNYTSFIIVRDPFLRLLSAYRDKVESKKQLYYRTLRCRIKDRHGQRKSGRDCRPSFSEFVDYVIEEDGLGAVPDEHWAPYYRFCSPCQVDFDYILHFESLSQDEAFLLENVPGLAEVVKPQTLHSSNTDYNQVASDYFRQLTATQLDALLKIYLKDFRIFGYSEAKYFNYINT